MLSVIFTFSFSHYFFDPIFNVQGCDDILDYIRSKAGGGINPYAIDYPVCKEKTASITSDQVILSKPHTLKVKSSQVLQLERLKRKTTKRGVVVVNDHDTPPFLPPQDHYRPCSELHTERFLNRPDVRKALHIDETKSPKSWADCSGMIDFSSDDIQTPTVDLYRQLVKKALDKEHQLNILVLSGDDDSVCATAGTQNWIWDLGVNASDAVSWEPWKVDDQTAGYVTQFDVGAGGANLTFVTVHGAGHEVPAYRPLEALALFKKYFSGQWI